MEEAVIFPQTGLLPFSHQKDLIEAKLGQVGHRVGLTEKYFWTCDY